eukprot:6124554-Prymnesium_polylepis.1
MPSLLVVGTQKGGERRHSEPTRFVVAWRRCCSGRRRCHAVTRMSSPRAAAGTSSLHYVLKSGWHAQIRLNDGEKEIHYFSLDDVYAKGAALYQQ